MNANGSGVVQLTREGVNTVPQWSPDGQRLYFHRVDLNPGRFSIYSIQPNGQDLRREITHPTANSEYVALPLPR
jgi:Tol biopolymer transport system component